MSGAMRIWPTSANIARDLATKMVRPAVQRPIGNRTSLFPRHVFIVTAAQSESAIKLDRLLAKLGKKAPAAITELGPQRGAAKVTARQALIG